MHYDVHKSLDFLMKRRNKRTLVAFLNKKNKSPHPKLTIPKSYKAEIYEKKK